MTRFLFIIAITAALALSGCISVPVAARTNTGQKFIGSADATFAGGTFNLVSANGVRCYGTYNPWEQALTKTLKFSTTDGRYGVFHREERPTLERNIIDTSERARANYRYVIGQHFGF